MRASSCGDDGVAVARIVRPQLAHERPQLALIVLEHGLDVPELAGRVGIFGVTASQGMQPQSDSRERLHDAVVQVARDAQPLLGAGGMPYLLEEEVLIEGREHEPSGHVRQGEIVGGGVAHVRHDEARRRAVSLPSDDDDRTPAS